MELEEALDKQTRSLALLPACALLSKKDHKLDDAKITFLV